MSLFTPGECRLYCGTGRRFSKLLLVIFCVLLASLRPSLPAPDPARIVAFGDLHGDYERLTLLLRKTGLTDAEGRWSGGEATLVVTGDFTDRGPDVRKVMDLLMELQKEASAAGGEAVTLLGNHEMMNFLGDLRYVSDETYASFADEDSEERRRKAWEQYVETARKQARRTRSEEPRFDQIKEQWMETHPLGFMEYREALGPEGKYGKWLRKLPAVVRVGRVLFAHAGIHPSLADLDVGEINRKLARERESFDEWKTRLVQEDVIASFYTINEIMTAARARFDILLPPEIRQGEGAESRIMYRFSRLSSQDQKLAQTLQSILSIGDWLSIRAEGPLWFRGFATWTEEEGGEQIEILAEKYDVDYFVVGHTISAEDKIDRRLNGRVILIDTLQPSALEIAGGEFYAVYSEERHPLDDLQGDRLSELILRN